MMPKVISLFVNGLDNNSECPMDYETSLLHKVFPRTSWQTTQSSITNRMTRKCYNNIGCYMFESEIKISNLSKLPGLHWFCCCQVDFTCPSVHTHIYINLMLFCHSPITITNITLMLVTNNENKTQIKHYLIC